MRAKVLVLAHPDSIMRGGWGREPFQIMYLRRLPATVLKIDKIFIDNVLEDPKELMFLKNIIDMAKSRGRTPLVEGVSEQRQVELLREIGCAIMQGYYFGKPVSAKEFTHLLGRGAVLPPG